MNMQSTNMQESILILTGMHRSGTSLTASLLQSAGLDIGERLMGDDLGNVKGHFENLDFVEFHQDLLDFHQLTQAGWTLKNDISVPPEYIEKAKKLIEKNQSKTFWGWKNPRTTLFLDFWAELAPEANFLFVYRSPIEVIDSIYRRGDEIFYENPTLVVELWMHYNKNILNFYSKYPHRCLIINVYTLTKNPGILLKSLEQKFNIRLGKLNEEIYEEKLLKTLDNKHCELIKNFYPEALNIYAELNTKASYTNDGDAFSLESNYSGSIKELCFQDWLKFRWKEREAERYKSQLQQSQKELTDCQTQLQHSQKELTDCQTQVQHSHNELADCQTQLQHSHNELTDCQTQLQHSHKELTDCQTQVQQTQTKLELLESLLDSHQLDKKKSESQIQETQTQLKNSHLQLQETHNQLEQLQSQLQQSHTQIQHEQTTIKAMETSKFWKLRSRWFGLREILGLTEKDKTFQDNLLIRLRHFWNVYRVKGLPYVANKVLQKSIEKAKYTPVPSHALPNIPQSSDVNYQKWLNKNYPTPEILKEKAQKIEKLSYKPLISLIMPVYNTPERFLRKAIESLLSQIYSKWELCIADDASSDSQIRNVLEEYSAKDSRIKVVFRAENGHISQCSNTALEIATGEFIALFDHDDLLTPDALYEIASLLNQHPEADMIYSDEDKIDERGKLRDPFFKPDWCPDSFLSRMYTCHLGVYRSEIINEIGGFREGYEGSQDYDLVLRFTEKTNKIFHIPKILYHWRIHSQSAASNPDVKPYAAIAAEKALADAMKRRGEEAQVTQAGSLVGHYIIRYKISEYKLVSIIIPTRDLGDTLDKCLTSIFEKTVYPNYEVILIDNGSKEQKTAEVFAKWQQKEPERFKCYQFDVPFNYSKINNFGVDKAQGDYLLFLNNDTEVVTSDWIDAMVEQAQRNSIGAIGALLLYPDNTIQHAGVVMGIGGVANHSHKHFSINSPGYFGQIMTVNNYSAVTAACLMCRREVFETVGGFEEKLKVAFNDVDFCLKIAQKGYRNIYLPQVMLYHYESKSRGYEDTPEKLIRFNKEVEYMQNKWKEFIENDPCYNPNLSKKIEDFSIEV